MFLSSTIRPSIRPSICHSVRPFSRTDGRTSSACPSSVRSCSVRTALQSIRPSLSVFHVLHQRTKLQSTTGDVVALNARLTGSHQRLQASGSSRIVVGSPRYFRARRYDDDDATCVHNAMMTTTATRPTVVFPPHSADRSKPRRERERDQRARRLVCRTGAGGPWRARRREASRWMGGECGQRTTRSAS